MTSALLAATAGCTVDGRAVPDFPALATLDTGAYDIDPLPAPAAGNAAYGRVVESVRMVEMMTLPDEVDATLDGIFGAGVIPLPTAVKASALLADPVAEVLRRHDMLAGAAINGIDDDTGDRPRIGSDRFLEIMVFRFPDDEAARRAARDIDASDAAVNHENVPVEITGFPTANAHWRPHVPTLAATLAHGPFAISVLAGHTTPDRAALTALVARTFELQSSRADTFHATPRERIADLPVDESGLVGLMTPSAPGRRPTPAVTVTDDDNHAGWSHIQAHGVTFGPRGASHFLGRPTEAVAVHGYNILIRYPDVATARARFTASVSRHRTDTTVRSVEMDTGTPDIHCRRNLGDTSWTASFCRVLSGPYEAVLIGRAAEDVRRRAFAQYGLLAAHGGRR